MYSVVWLIDWLTDGSISDFSDLQGFFISKINSVFLNGIFSRETVGMKFILDNVNCMEKVVRRRKKIDENLLHPQPRTSRPRPMWSGSSRWPLLCPSWWSYSSRPSVTTKRSANSGGCRVKSTRTTRSPRSGTGRRCKCRWASCWWGISSKWNTVWKTTLGFYVFNAVFL